MRTAMLMTLTIAVVGAGAVAGAAPAAAYDYPWCLQGRDTGYPGDCSYTSYPQCMASASGRYAYCGINPRLAFGPPQVPPRRGGYYRNDYGY